MDVKIMASMMCADLGALAEGIRVLEAAGVDGFHFDIMDGSFVPNIVMGPAFLAALRPVTRLPFEAHLMVWDPLVLLPALAEAGCDLCLIHGESRVPLPDAIEAVVRAGMQAGVAITPSTAPAAIASVLPHVRRVVVMTVEPGFAGHPILPGAQARVEQTAALLRAAGARAEVEVDGNVNPGTVPSLVRAGATVLVGGSSGLFVPGLPFEDAVLRLRAAAAQPV